MLGTPIAGEATVAGRIMLVRQSGGPARFTVRIDDERVGKLAAATWQAVEVEPGTHRVRVSHSGYSSKTLLVSVAEGEAVVLLSRRRFVVNYLNSLSGALVGGSGYWLFAHGPTPTRLTAFGVGVAGAITVYAARLMISLRPAPASQAQ
jgi:hypothetical protein